MKDKKLEEYWEREKKNHLGDYGDSSVFDIYCAFRAGWEARMRYNKRMRN